jgi:hypothetical protein
MPKYRNDTAARLVIDGQPLEAGDTIETTGWYVIAGLTKLADDPVNVPVILSQVVAISGDVDIPTTANNLSVTRYTIKIRGLTGSAGNTIAFNVAGATPVLDVEDGDEFVFNCMGRSIVKLVCTIAAGSIKVDVLRW